MYAENPYFTCIDHWVTVWVGDLDEAGLEAYLEEHGVDDNAPISDFSKDLGCWYDHDFIWYEASETPLPLALLCQLNGIDSEALIKTIIERSNADKASSLLLLWNAKIKIDDGRSFAKGKLRCLGSWEHPSPLTDDDYE